MNRLSFSRPALCPARLLLTTLAAMVLGACSGSENTASTTASTPTVLTPALFVFYDSDGNNKGDSIARIDLNTHAVLATAVVGVSGTGGTHKQAYYDGPLWVGAGSDVYGIDPTTLQVIPRQVSPYVQGNRSGTIGSAIVNALSLIAQSLGFSSPDPAVQAAEAERERLSQYFDRTSFTAEEAQVIDICAVRSSRSGLDSNFGQVTEANLLAAAIAVPAAFHNMGYIPVGIEPAPDGKLTEFSVRQGDHSFFLDTDPASPTFGYPVRFVYPRLGQVKDQNNNIVSTFTAQYTAAGGTAPGRLHYNRSGQGVPSETDPLTYTEPCDSTSLRNVAGQVWTWWPDVNGDTLTGVNMDSLTTASPQVFQVPVPILTRSTAAADRGGTGSAGQAAATGITQRVGPWMASLTNRNVGNEFIFHVETEGDNSQMLWNVTDPANVFEIQRMVGDLKNVLTPDLATQTPGSPTAFTNGTTYTVLVNFVSTGGTSTSVNYQYVSLAGDNFSGISSDATRAYLRKVTATDPGPNFILNGLNGRASTSEANVVRRQGSGPETTIYSDEIWLLTGVGFPEVADGFDGFQVVNLRPLSPPWLITETFAFPSASAGSFSPDGKKFIQIVSNQVNVIDAPTRSLVDIVSLPGPATGFVFGSYHAPVTTPTGDGGTGSGGGGGGGGGGGIPPNPCGG